MTLSSGAALVKRMEIALLTGSKTNSAESPTTGLSIKVMLARGTHTELMPSALSA